MRPMEAMVRPAQDDLRDVEEGSASVLYSMLRSRQIRSRSASWRAQMKEW